MAYLVTRIICLLCGIVTATSITVSPDIGLRNQSVPDQTEELTKDIPKSIGNSERFRRLIPYSTFYIPNFQIQDFYNLNPIQQQRMVAPLGERGSVGPPQRHEERPDTQVTRLQPHMPQTSANGNPGAYTRPRPPHSFNIKFPSSRPNYQIIAYNTRHQSPPPPQAMPLYREPVENPSPNAIHSTLLHQHQEIDHKLPPLSYKNSNLNIPYPVYQQNSGSKTIFTPFTNKNKIPGGFRPIVYTDTEQVLTSQENKQAQAPENDRGQAEQQRQEPSHQERQPEHEQPEHTGEAQQPSSTQRPLYYEEITRKPIAESAEDLTPQEKYVAYLQQQIQRQTQRLKQQYQEPTYIEPSKLAASRDEEPKHPQNVPSTTQTTFVYPQVSSSRPNSEELYDNAPQKNAQHSPKTPPASVSIGNKNNYLQYLQQHPEQIIQIPNLIPSNLPYNAYNPLVYYSTPNPNYLSSLSHSQQRLPQIEPLYEADPVFKVPVKKPPPAIHQHLTETSKNFSPILTSYHPDAHQVTTAQPDYNSYNAPPRSQKKKQAHNYRPTPTPASAEDTNTNTVRFPDEVPHTRPIQVDRPELQPQEVPMAQQEEHIQHLPIYRPIQRPNHLLLQRPPPQNFLPDYAYQPDIVEIPRQKLRPKLRPEMVLKLRPQPYPGQEYRPDLRPSSSYLLQPDNAPTVIVKQRPHMKHSPYARPNPEQITHLHLRPGPYHKQRVNVKINPDLLAPMRPEYNPNIFDVPNSESESESNSGPISQPDSRPPAIQQEQYESEPENSHLSQRPQSPPQPESKPEHIESEDFYTHHTEASHEPPNPSPVYVQESEIKPESESSEHAEKSDSEPEPSHPIASPTPISSQEEIDPNEDDQAENNLALILRKLQDTNQLPKTLTPDNIDNSIRTLIKILNNLKKTQTLDGNNPPQQPEEENEYQEIDLPPQPVSNKKPGPGSGRPGIDYPILDEIPKTSFNCKEQRYKGFFGDPETGCQAWHYCDLNGGQATFLCPNGTIFSQVALTCDWWFNVKCSSTAQLYVLNERLYKYILPFTPKFPEDYSGPLVDKYLALKFQEMEDKMRRERLKGKKADENADVNNSGPHNETLSVEAESEEESSEEVELGSSSIDTYSSTEHSLTTEITSNSISPDSVSPTQESSENNKSFPSPSSTTAYAAVSPSDVVASTAKSKITVESEKIEVIEIKANGDSGHLSPSHTYIAED